MVPPHTQGARGRSQGHPEFLDRPRRSGYSKDLRRWAQHRGDAPQVESELERLRKRVDNFPSASLYTRLAELSRQAGDHTGAEATCRRCIKEFPRSAQAYVILAEMKLAIGAKAEAANLIATAIEKEPRSYQALRLAADLAPSPAVAVKHLQAILVFKPGDGPVTARIHELGGSTTAPVVAPVTAAAPAPAPVTGRIARQSGTSAALDMPLAMPSPVTAAIRAATPAKGSALDALCAESGVRGACVADAQGRIVASKRLNDQDELLAAFGAELQRAASASLALANSGAPHSFSLLASQGQVLAFTRDRQLTVLVVAEPGVRPAMLELRARQALIDLGAA